MKLPKSSTSSSILLQSTNGNVLTVEEYGEYWGIPRGHVEPGEDLGQTAIRELFEETGIKYSGKLSLIGNYARFTFDEEGAENGEEYKHIYVYHGRLDGEPKTEPHDEAITDIAWRSLESLIQLQRNDKDRFFLEYCRKWIQDKELK